jgi:tRNA-dependent cyclodipeptide synthase
MIKNDTDITLATLAKNPNKNADECKAVLLISIGSHDEEAKYLATFDMLESLNFEEVEILVACELQANTLYGIGVSDDLESAKKLAISKGDDWVDKYSPYIKKLKNHKITRWYDFTKSNDYIKFRTETDELASNNKEVKQSLTKTTSEFLERYNDQHIDKQHLVTQSLIYLQNECPIIPVYKNRGYDYILYNNAPNNTFQMLLKYYNTLAESKIIWLRFDFSIRKANTLKLNAVQTKKHGFSCGRKDLERYINDISNISYFFNKRHTSNNESIGSGNDQNSKILLKHIEQQLNMLKETISILPENEKENVYRMIEKQLLPDSEPLKLIKSK